MYVPVRGSCQFSLFLLLNLYFQGISSTLLKLCNLLKSTFSITRHSSFERLLPFLRHLYVAFLSEARYVQNFAFLFYCLEGMGYMLAVWKRARPQMENFAHRLGKVSMMGRIPSCCVSLTITLSSSIVSVSVSSTR